MRESHQVARRGLHDVRIPWGRHPDAGVPPPSIVLVKTALDILELTVKKRHVCRRAQSRVVQELVDVHRLNNLSRVDARLFSVVSEGFETPRRQA